MTVRIVDGGMISIDTNTGEPRFFSGEQEVDGETFFKEIFSEMMGEAKREGEAQRPTTAGGMSPRFKRALDAVAERPEDGGDNTLRSARVVDEMLSLVEDGYIDTREALALNRHICNSAMFSDRCAQLTNETMGVIQGITSRLLQFVQETEGPGYLPPDVFHDLVSTVQGHTTALSAILGSYEDAYYVMTASVDRGSEIGVKIDDESERRGEWARDESATGAASAPDSSQNPASATE